jgi:threonine aldolase
LAETFGFRRKRGGHLFSKMRFLSAQLEAYITDDLWLKNAARANNMATKLAQGLVNLPSVKLCHPVEANEVFLELPETVINAVLADGFKFYRWQGNTIRLVTAFDTKEEDVNALIESIKRYSL